MISSAVEEAANRLATCWPNKGAGPGGEWVALGFPVAEDRGDLASTQTGGLLTIRRAPRERIGFFMTWGRAPIRGVTPPGCAEGEWTGAEFDVMVIDVNDPMSLDTPTSTGPTGADPR